VSMVRSWAHGRDGGGSNGARPQRTHDTCLRPFVSIEGRDT
jgi:hypothetical protein